MSTNENDIKAFALLSKAFELPSEKQIDWLKQQTQGDDALFLRAKELLDAESLKYFNIKTGGAALALDEPPMPDRAGGYKIIARIGHGGMGSVYKGVRDQGDFEHIVAIKIIRPGILSEKLNERFIRERQILASLTHPNIARLYDGGQLADNSPYIIMELVNGQSITEFSDTNSLSLDGRLELFETACEAVLHAHQNLIIHRDITPSNVMVDPDGVVKLIDFGIAKPNEENSDSCNMTTEGQSLASLSFTPGYAAPERSYGAAASTLTDVYSLGKLLNALTQKQGQDADLLAIIDFATKVELSDRYPSVNVLLDDIKRYRNGYTVSARAGGTRYRFGKYFRRHTLGIVLSAFATIATISALITMSFLYQQAEIERAEAMNRFNDVRELADFMMFELYDDVADMPRSTAVRRKMAEFAQRYIEDLGSSDRADQSLRLDTITGWLRLGDIQGNSRFANLGEVSAAVASYARAEASLSSLDEQSIQSWRARFLKALAVRSQADMAIYKDLNMSKAKTLGLDAANQFEALIQSGNDEQVLNAKAELMSVLIMVVDAQNKMSEANESLQLLDKIASLKAQINTDDPRLREDQQRWLAYADPMSKFRRAEALYGLALLNRESSSSPFAEPYASESVAYFRASMEAFEKLATVYPDWRRVQRNQVVAPWMLGNVLSELMRFEEADEYIDLALSRAQRFAATDEDDSEAGQLVTAIRSSRAYFKAFAMKSYDGIEELRALTDAAQARASERPDDIRAQIMSLVLLRPTADALKNLGLNEEACTAFRQAKSRYEKAAQSFDLPPDFVLNDVKSVENEVAICEG